MYCTFYTQKQQNVELESIPFSTFRVTPVLKMYRLIWVPSLNRYQRYMSYRRYRPRTYRLLHIVNDCTVRLSLGSQNRAKVVRTPILKHHVEPADLPPPLVKKNPSWKVLLLFRKVRYLDDPREWTSLQPQRIMQPLLRQAKTPHWLRFIIDIIRWLLPWGKK